MERTIKEGNDYLQRMEQVDRARQRNQNGQKRQRELREVQEQKKQKETPKKIVQQKQVQVKREKQEKQQNKTKEDLQKQSQISISKSSRKIEKKTPIQMQKGQKNDLIKQKVQKQSQPEKRKSNNEMEVEKKNEKLVAKKQEMKVEKSTAKPQQQQQQQPKQGPRKTKSNISAASDVNQPSIGMVDCVFVVDTTGSMDVYLERTTDAVQMLVERIKQQSKNEQVSVRFGLVCYRDHPPQELTYVTELHDLCSNREILKAIQKSDCSGGGDGAEAVLDGLNVAAQQISWRDSSKIPSLRYIFHICDQPPHGKEFGGYSELWDQTGCPCGLKPDQIIHRINMRQIHYRLIKADHTRLEKFADYFRGKVVNYDEVTLENGVADGMEIKISDMVIRELCPDILLD
ncbi:unnamed protein product (macronuclear) [Paramecium tetraurelia]|uniref:VWFA domain-containing protein n=1 Tax=Paramecium tetraurelia TaxID=5888 RepID=A0E7Z4_PARTE|nr:uncharacterized protein GSPATT00024139001 [Paramecium tetraurelia]CAK91411.1 unnamed protein product [Paramecium tetraurelia]|eukprot:XP_001458808.1 hypothetical protein (macronuclear) [Paramecium tetraurelia strain d4-2]